MFNVSKALIFPKEVDLSNVVEDKMPSADATVTEVNVTDTDNDKYTT